MALKISIFYKADTIEEEKELKVSKKSKFQYILRKLGKAHIEILVFPDEVHGFLGHDIWLKVYKATADFFDRLLHK